MYIALRVVCPFPAVRIRPAMRVRMHQVDSTRTGISTNSMYLEGACQNVTALRVLPRAVSAGTNAAEETQLTSLAATAYHGFAIGSQGDAGGSRHDSPSDDAKCGQAGFLGSARLYADAGARYLALRRKYALPRTDRPGRHTNHSRLWHWPAHARQPLNREARWPHHRRPYPGHALPLGPYSGHSVLPSILRAAEPLPFL